MSNEIKAVRGRYNRGTLNEKITQENVDIRTLLCALNEAREIIESMMRYADSMGDVDWGKVNDFLVKTK